MSPGPASPAPRLRLRLALTCTAVASVILGLGIVWAKRDAVAAQAGRSAGFHAPNLDLLFAESPLVVTHVLLAVAALALGPVMLLSRKGAAFHRAAGWTWVALMAATAASTFLIVGGDGRYSYIHAMSAVTLVLLPLAVHAARTHAIRRHRALMLWLFWLMLVGAAAFTLVPGRLVWLLFFG